MHGGLERCPQICGVSCTGLRQSSIPSSALGLMLPHVLWGSGDGWWWHQGELVAPRGRG